MAVNFITIFGRVATIYGRLITIFGILVTISGFRAKVFGLEDKIYGSFEKVFGGIIIKNGMTTTILDILIIKKHLLAILAVRKDPLNNYELQAH